MNNDTFKNAFNANLGANFNIATTNNINKIIKTYYNIYKKIYPKNFDQFENKFRKNNEKSQIILKNNSSVNVLLTFFPYNNTNNSCFYGKNMFSFLDIKQGFWEIFRKIFEKSNLNYETILKNNSSINVLLTFFHYNDSNNSGNNNWFYGGNMLSFCYIKQGFWEIFEEINKLINNTFEIFIRKLNFINRKNFSFKEKYSFINKKTNKISKKFIYFFKNQNFLKYFLIFDATMHVSSLYNKRIMDFELIKIFEECNLILDELRGFL